MKIQVPHLSVTNETGWFFIREQYLHSKIKAFLTRRFLKIGRKKEA